MKQCPICLEDFIPVNEVDDNGELTGTTQQNCNCDIALFERAVKAEARIKELESFILFVSQCAKDSPALNNAKDLAKKLLKKGER